MPPAAWCQPVLPELAAAEKSWWMLPSQLSGHSNADSGAVIPTNILPSPEAPWPWPLLGVSGGSAWAACGGSFGVILADER